MSQAAERALFWLLATYLGVFAFLTPNYEYVRREHSLIWWGIRERASELRAAGETWPRASLRAWGEFASEINPVALIAKTVTDAATAPRDLAQLRWYPLRLGAVAAAVLVVYAVMFVPLPEQPPPNLIVQPASDPGGQIAVLAEVGSLREGIYRATGVCIARDVTGPVLTEELLRDGSPGADCSDLDRPRPQPTPA